MPKVLYIDFSSGFEDISLNPKRYGGVGRTIALLKENIKNFYIICCGESFENNPNHKNVFFLSKEDINLIRNGVKLSNFINDNDYDLVFHNATDVFINTKLKQLVWGVGQYEQFDIRHENCLFHNYKTQQPIINNLNSKIYEFILGIEQPEFKEYQKENFIFQCSNHFNLMGSIELAIFCNRNKIDCVFAGPIAENYKLLDYMGQYAKYIGEITEDVKIEILKSAKMYGSLFQMPINTLTLGIKQAMSYGCSILSTYAGAIPNYIKNNYNGFLIRNENEFIDAWECGDDIKQLNCYNTIKDNFSKKQMVESFNDVVNKVLNE